MSAKSKFMGGPFSGHSTSHPFPAECEIHITVVTTPPGKDGSGPSRVKRGSYVRIGTINGEAAWRWKDPV